MAQRNLIRGDWTNRGAGLARDVASGTDRWKLIRASDAKPVPELAELATPQCEDRNSSQARCGSNPAIPCPGTSSTISRLLWKANRFGLPAPALTRDRSAAHRRPGFCILVRQHKRRDNMTSNNPRDECRQASATSWRGCHANLPHYPEPQVYAAVAVPSGRMHNGPEPSPGTLPCIDRWQG